MPKYNNGDGISFIYEGEVCSGNIIANPRNVNGVYVYQTEFIYNGETNYADISEVDIKGIV